MPTIALVIFDNDGSGISVFDGARNRILNNTLFGNVRDHFRRGELMNLRIGDEEGAAAVQQHVDTEDLAAGLRTDRAGDILIGNIEGARQAGHQRKLAARARLAPVERTQHRTQVVAPQPLHARGPVERQAHRPTAQAAGRVSRRTSQAAGSSPPNPQMATPPTAWRASASMRRSRVTASLT